jgi:hypothetical protein
MKRTAKKTTELTQTQFLALRAARIAQQTIKIASFGRIKPLWVLPLAAHFSSKNRNKNSKTGDSEPGLPSHRWQKEIEYMIASRYKRRALVLT